MEDQVRIETKKARTELLNNAFPKITLLFTAALAVLFSVSLADAADDLSAYYGFDPIEIIKLNWNIKNLNVADFNADGLNDIAVVNNRKSKIEILLQKPDKENLDENDTAGQDDDINELTGPVGFTRTEVLVTVDMANLVTGDLNSDGLVDMAFYGKPNGLYVILQADDRAKEKKQSISWRKRRKIKIDDGLSRPKALACGDLNGDGKSDLVLAGKGAIYIIYQDEKGLLNEPVKHATIALTLAVKLADLNGDEQTDLILLTDDREKPLHVRFGLNNGQLSAQMRFFIENSRALEFFDYDADGTDEILTVEKASGRLTSYKLSKPKDQLSDYPIQIYPLEAGNESKNRDLVIADFDGNGLDDVVISNPDSAQLTLYKQTAGIGLSEPAKFGAFANITSLSAADIDADGKAELAVLSVKEKAIGISSFADGKLLFPKLIELDAEPIAMELGDMDNNGTIDCAYVSKQTDDDTRSFGVVYNVANDKNRRLSKPVNLEKLMSNPNGLKIIDADQDGLSDCLIFQKYEPPIVVHQTGKECFEVIDSPKSRASLIKDASLRSAVVADINASGSAELLIAQQNFARSLVFAGGKSWEVIDQYNAKNGKDNISTVAAFNLDADLVPEILLLNGKKGELQILKAGDDKTYRLQKQLDVNKWTNTKNLKMLFRKLTPGNAKSILIFDGDKFALVTLPTRQSPGKFDYQLSKLFSYETKIKKGSYARLTAGDINSDGFSDIIMLENKKNHIEILALKQNAPAEKPISVLRFKIFEEKTFRRSDGNAFAEPREFMIADVTGDGANDLITIIHDRIIIYPQDY